MWLMISALLRSNTVTGKSLGVVIVTSNKIYTITPPTQYDILSFGNF
jgi:hypothetical protein